MHNFSVLARRWGVPPWVVESEVERRWISFELEMIDVENRLQEAEQKKQAKN